MAYMQNPTSTCSWTRQQFCGCSNTQMGSKTNGEIQGREIHERQ